MLLKTAPKHIWKGKSRLAKRLVRYYKDLLMWAISIRPGDYIASCVGYNVKVASIEYSWQNEGLYSRSKQNKTWFLYEVSFTDVDGGYHVCPGGGCALPKETPEQVTKYLIAYAKAQIAKPTDWTTAKDYMIVEAAEAGNPIVDEFGTLLPQFKNKGKI